MISRRHLISTILFGITSYTWDKAYSQENAILSLPLWNALPPGGGGPTGSPLVTHHHALYNIAIPSLTIFRPHVPNGIAILIASGGGYTHIAIEKEAIPTAKWLNTLGITACILTYRLPTERWTVGRLAPFQDIQRAIRIIRSQAHRLNINHQHIGALGFSAGGHLVGMQALRPSLPLYTPQDIYDTLPDNLSFACLLYPIVTLEKPYIHTQTYHSLVSPRESTTLAHTLSLQNAVQTHAPPFLIIHTADDPIAPPPHAVCLQNALLHHHIPVTRHLFPTGGHGFGLGRPNTKTLLWPSIAREWIKKHNI